ncbi:MAG TPA: hypothetical protein VFJ66_00165 [Gaiellales bacterium]|nr:hypothetical protein [Gaiellales bacterium]
MIRRPQLGIAVTVAAVGLAVLLAEGRGPAVDTGHDRPRLPVAVSLGHRQMHPLTPSAYAAFAGAQDRFTIAGRALSKALGGCRMRLGSFNACARPALSEMAFESKNLAIVTTTFERRGGPCGHALQLFKVRLSAYMQAARSFSRLPHSDPMSALTRLQRKLLTAQEAYALAGLRVRGTCRPG